MTDFQFRYWYLLMHLIFPDLSDLMRLEGFDH